MGVFWWEERSDSGELSPYPRPWNIAEGPFIVSLATLNIEVSKLFSINTKSSWFYFFICSLFLDCFCSALISIIEIADFCLSYFDRRLFNPGFNCFYYNTTFLSSIWISGLIFSLVENSKKLFYITEVEGYGC